jgi:hypothetical protein
MMRRGPLSTYSVESLLSDASRERINGVLELTGDLPGRIYLVEGDIYYAERPEDPPLDERLVANGVLTQEQVDTHGVPGAEGLYLARALDTDLTIDEDAIDAYLLDATAATLSVYLEWDEGEFELDPYGTHPAGVLSSWKPDVVIERVEVLRAEEAERLEAERLEAERLEAERLEAERLEAERLEAERLEAERLEAERLEAERLEAERLEAERLAAEQAEAERVAAEKAEAERLEAEQAEAERLEAEKAEAEKAEAEKAEAERLAAEEAEKAEKAEAEAKEKAAEEAADADGPAPSYLFDRLAAASVPLADRKPGGLGELTPGTVIVLPEEPPEGMDRIELAGVEWRVLVRGGRGDTVGSIADRLELSLETVQAVVDGLWCRGLVATVHPEVAAPA